MCVRARRSRCLSTEYKRFHALDRITTQFQGYANSRRWRSKQILPRYWLVLRRESSTAPRLPSCAASETLNVEWRALEIWVTGHWRSFNRNIRVSIILPFYSSIVYHFRVIWRSEHCDLEIYVRGHLSDIPLFVGTTAKH